MISRKSLLKNLYEIKILDIIFHYDALLKNLRRLWLEENQISGLKGLENIEWLDELDLGRNKIPANLIEELGGSHKYDRAKEPQNFIDYCKKRLR